MRAKMKKVMWAIVPGVALLFLVTALLISAAQTPDAEVSADHLELPGAPQNLMATANGHHEIRLSWDAPSAGGSVVGYRIDRSEGNEAWSALRQTHSSTSYSDSGLDASEEYCYRVFASNGFGTGPVSDIDGIDNCAVTAEIAVPSRVRSLKATAIDQNAIRLTWQAPERDGGAPVTKYSIEWTYVDGDGAVHSGTPIDRDVSDGTSYQHNGLTASTWYTYQVYAGNSEGQSKAEGNTATVQTKSLTRPGAPTDVTAVQTGARTGARTFSLYWYAPADNGGTVPVDYEVEAQYNGRGSYLDITTTWRTPAGTSEDTTLEVPDNVPDSSPAVPIESVRFRVYAITRADDTGTVGVDEELKSRASRSSARMTIRTDEWRDENLPDVPTFAAAPAIRTPKGNVNLSWTAPAIDGDDTNQENEAPDSIDGYRIDVSDDGLHWHALTDHTRKTATEYHYVDPANKDLYYRIFAWHATYLGPSSTNSVVSSLDPAVVQPPGPVQNFTATAVSSAQIDLSWTAPTYDGNAHIVRYRVDAVRAADDGTFVDLATAEAAIDLPTASTDATVLLAVTKTTSYMHKNLNAGETWKYRVLAINDSEDDEDIHRYKPANPATAPTEIEETRQASIPDAPTGLVVHEDNSGLTLRWNAPNLINGASVGGYRIQRKKGDAPWETITSDTGGHSTTASDSPSPQSGQVWQYRVAALNAAGVVGPWSTPAYFPVTALPPGKPATMSAVRDATVPESKINVSWSAASGGVTGYILERRHEGDMMGDIPANGYSGANGANSSFAFSNHKQWWETLSCLGMLRAAGSQADPSVSSTDKTKWCNNFAGTAPTNNASPDSAITSATAGEVKALFDKRFVLISSAATTSSAHDGLMANTQYRYRVRAVHSAKAGPWSDTATVTTASAVTLPVVGANIAAQSVGVGASVRVQSTITHSGPLTWRAASSSSSVATATVDASGLVTITGVASGTATITVTATAADGSGASQQVSVSVTVMVPQPPVGVSGFINHQGGQSDVTVTWRPGANAVAHGVMLFTSDYARWPYIGVARGNSHIFRNVAAGAYYAVVVVLDAMGEPVTDAFGGYVYGFDPTLVTIF